MGVGPPISYMNIPEVPFSDSAEISIVGSMSVENVSKHSLINLVGLVITLLMMSSFPIAAIVLNALVRFPE